MSETVRLTLDTEVCIGVGQCELLAPDVFELDDDEGTARMVGGPDVALFEIDVFSSHGSNSGKIGGLSLRRIVEHILVLSFGERFRVEMHDFVRIFYEYKKAGLIKK